MVNSNLLTHLKDVYLTLHLLTTNFCRFRFTVHLCDSFSGLEASTLKIHRNHISHPKNLFFFFKVYDFHLLILKKYYLKKKVHPTKVD